jgi:hypothetical protein
MGLLEHTSETDSSGSALAVSLNLRGWTHRPSQDPIRARRAGDHLRHGRGTDDLRSAARRPLWPSHASGCARRPSLIHGDRGWIEPWHGETSQAEAVKRASNFLTSTYHAELRNARAPQVPAVTGCHKGRTPPANRRDAPATEADARNRPVLCGKLMSSVRTDAGDDCWSGCGLLATTQLPCRK